MAEAKTRFKNNLFASFLKRGRQVYYAHTMKSAGRGVILLYHRIATPQIDPLLLCVSPKHFQQHIEVIRSGYHCIPLLELASASQSNTIPPWTVSITFDDGYLDNWQMGAPILENEGMRATVFITGQTLQGVDFFYDQLEDVFFHTRDLPRVLSFPMYGKEWDLGDWSTLPERPDSFFWDWNIGQKGNPTPRHRAYREIFQWLREAPAALRNDVMSQLSNKVGSNFHTAPMRGIRYPDLQRMGAIRSIDIGAHTMTHPVLCRLDLEEQKNEIEAGKQILEEGVGHPVETFAYPYGSSWDVSSATVGLAERAGFSVSCANMEGTVQSGSGLHWLPRFLVRDWSGEEFADRLVRFFRAQEIHPPQG
jgi:peptidoglycan/xylan/chitin deacetylase (PgdA/CDA1 family)